MDSSSSTSLSLLLQIKQGTQREEAWRAFVDRYGSRIYQWCIQRNLQPQDAEDVTQNVLIKLAKRLKTFEYDPAGSFRGLLRRITENALNDFFHEQRQRNAGGRDDISRLELAEARADLALRLEAAFDLELLDKAIERVRNRVSESRFLAWELAAKNGLSGAEIGQRLNMKIASVYTARNQVQNLLQEEVRQLEQHADGAKVTE